MFTKQVPPLLPLPAIPPIKACLLVLSIRSLSLLVGILSDTNHPLKQQSPRIVLSPQAIVAWPWQIGRLQIALYH